MNGTSPAHRRSHIGRRCVWALGVSLFVVATGCGYRSVRAVAPSGRLDVRLGECSVDALVAGDVLLALRAALSRDSVLGAAGDPVLVIDVLRMDDTSAAVVASSGAPRARATKIALVGRAHVDAPGGFDSGDITAESSVSSPVQPRAQAIQTEDALRDLARRLGQALADRILGAPAGLRNGSRGVTDMLLSRP